MLAIASLLSVAFSAFQVTFKAQVGFLTLMGIAIALSAYIMFEIDGYRHANEREFPRRPLSLSGLADVYRQLTIIRLKEK